MRKYVHGYTKDEANRLNDQADSLANLLHYDSIWEEGSLILEAGCGVNFLLGKLGKSLTTKNSILSSKTWRDYLKEKTA